MKIIGGQSPSGPVVLHLELELKNSRSKNQETTHLWASPSRKLCQDRIHHLFFLPFLTFFVSLFSLISDPSGAFAIPCDPGALFCTSAQLITPEGGNVIITDTNSASASRSGTFVDITAPPDPTLLGTTIGNTFVLADYGSLHATATAETTSPLLFGDGSAGFSRAIASFFDYLTPVSSTLPIGTPVQVRIEMSGDGIMGATGNSGANFGANSTFEAGMIIGNTEPLDASGTATAGGTLSLVGANLTLIPGGATGIGFHQSAIITEYVGERFLIGGNLQVMAFSSTFPDCFSALGTCIDQTNPADYAHPDSLANSSFFDTSTYGITSLTPGISFLSASGATYPGLAPVPEPSTLLLLGSGLAGLAAWRLKKSA